MHILFISDLIKIAFKHIKQSLNHKMYVSHNAAYVWTQFLYAGKYLLSKIIYRIFPNRSPRPNCNPVLIEARAYKKNNLKKKIEARS